MSGEIELQVNDGPNRVYRAGESFFETRGLALPESSRANANDRLPRASLGLVEGGDGIVEGRDGADIRP